MSIKEFKELHKDFCNKYNEILDLYYRCSEYLETGIRTEAEIEKFCKMLITYSKSLSNMMGEYKVLTKKEMDNRTILGGFIQYDKVS